PKAVKQAGNLVSGLRMHPALSGARVDLEPRPLYRAAKRLVVTVQPFAGARVGEQQFDYPAALPEHLTDIFHLTVEIGLDLGIQSQWPPAALAVLAVVEVEVAPSLTNLKVSQLAREDFLKPPAGEVSGPGLGTVPFGELGHQPLDFGTGPEVFP